MIWRLRYQQIRAQVHLDSRQGEVEKARGKEKDSILEDECFFFFLFFFSFLIPSCLPCGNVKLDRVNVQMGTFMSCIKRHC